MPELYYEALTPTGQATCGVLDADTVAEASVKLAACELTPQHLSDRVPLRAVAPPTSTAAAAEIRETFRMLAEATCSAPLRRQAKLLVQTGAIDAARPAAEFMQTLLQYGERLGDPLTALSPLIELERERQRMQRESRGKFLYAYCLLLLASGLFSLTDLFVGDPFRKMFADFELRMSQMQSMLLQSGPLFWGMTALLLLGPLFVFAAQFLFRQRLWFDRGLDAIFLCGPWRRWGHTAQALAFLGVMLKAGKPVPNACEASADALPRPFQSWQLREWSRRTREGAPLAAACLAAKVHPMIIPFLLASERQSMLPQGCFTAARLLLERSRRRRIFFGYAVESFVLVFVLVSAIALFTSYLMPIYILLNNLGL